MKYVTIKTEKICGGIDLLKLKRMFSLILAITTLLGGSAMATDAAKTNNDTAENKTVYAHELDAQAYNGNDLGAVYTPKSTTFKVWAPTASGVAVKLYATGSPDEEGAQDISTTTMKKGANGVWSVTLNGDKKNIYYTYLVTINGVTTETADVYSKAVGVNGNRSMVVDLESTNPEGWDKDSHILYDDPTDAVVWEVHVRDFSSSEVSGVSLKYRGKYLAFTEKGTTLDGKGEVSTCIDYLKNLGVTHVQLLPVYDYATVDETQEDPEEYNWGYDPKNYNVPEGSYSTNAFDGNVRIREFKEMIKALHDAGIGVIMDVVYNHTYTAKGSCFENTVPGYYFRLNEDGSFADASACGNETASDHLMYRKYMIDSVLYWTNEYHIDGFRFDLMGILDVETMNQIRKALDTQVKDGDKIIMYGEPWAAGAVATKEKTCTKDNLKLLDSRIGVFNDAFRDAVKGHVFNAHETGFIQDGSNKAPLISSITANSIDSLAWLNQPSQSVAYMSAHDNFTLYDKLVLSVKGDESFGERDNRLVSMNKLAAAIMLTSQGISFMQAGEEFARTKYGDENSFISSDKINQLDWNSLVKYADLNSYYQGLIEIRKNFKPFRDPTTTSAKKITFSDTDSSVIAYTIENTITKGKEWSFVALAFNAGDKDAEISLKSDGSKLPDQWEIIADEDQAGLKGLGEVSSSKIVVPAKSAVILADKESFDKLALQSDKCSVVVEYKDSGSGEVISRQVIKGAEGSGYTTDQDRSLDLRYDYISTEGNASGRFTKSEQTVTYLYKKFEGNIYTLTVNYLKENKSLLSTGDIKLAESVTEMLRDGDDYNAKIRNIDGMKINMDAFPTNALGKVNGADITIDYYYIPADESDLVIHYYSPESSKVYAQVYIKDDDGDDDYLTDKQSGAEMQADKDLGSGWFTLKLDKKGSMTGLTVKFSGKTADPVEYSVNREVWIKDGEVIHTGEINVIYVRSGGELIASEVIKGKEGEGYRTEEKEFENLKVYSTSLNTSGSFADSPIYVIYSYEELDITEKPVMTVIYVLCGSALLTIAAAAVMGAVYHKRKKRWQ